MPSDEEFRKVAEDMRALARSLARDVWDAAQGGRGEGRTAADAVRRSVRQAVRGARQEFRQELHRHRRGAWPGPPGRPHWVPPGSPPGATGPPGPPWAPPPYAAPWQPRPHRPPRPRSPLPPVRRRWDGPGLLAVLVAGFGMAWLVGAVGAAHLSVEGTLAVGLMLLGLALIVTARTDWSLSRHMWPVLLGVVMVIALFSTSASFGVTGALSHVSVGNIRATAPASGGTVYGGFGRLTVDATAVRAGSVLDIESLVGDTRVRLAPGQIALVDGRVLLGRVCLDGQARGAGVGAASGPLAVPQAGHPSVTIHIRQLAGQVSVGAQGCARP